jgi:hypothetical protein
MGELSIITVCSFVDSAHYGGGGQKAQGGDQEDPRPVRHIVPENEYAGRRQEEGPQGQQPSDQQAPGRPQEVSGNPDWLPLATYKCM